MRRIVIDNPREAIEAAQKRLLSMKAWTFLLLLMEEQGNE